MNSNEMVEISVIVPAYNEGQRLPKTLPHLWRALNRRFARFEIIVVDDGSTDETAEIVNSFGNAHDEVRLLRSAQNRGKGNAVRLGILEAAGRHVLFSDADLSTPLKEVRKLQAALGEGYDVAIGSRASREAKILKCQPFYRVLMGKTFNKIVRLLAVSGVRDTQCGFKCFPRHLAREIFSCCRIDGFSFDVEVLFVARHKGLRIKEVGVLWRNSPLSTVNPIIHSLQMVRDLFRIRLNGLLGYYGRQGVLRTRIEA
jgi:dolichyl-phosphate beta-glucosyltransferase